MATYPLSEAYANGDVLSAAAYNSTNEGINDLAFGIENAQVGTAYTLALTDVAKIVTLNNGSAITLTVPTNATVAFPIGTQIVIGQLGTGQVTVSHAGVDVWSNGTKKKLNGQYAFATLWKAGTNTWYLFGNTAL